MKAQTRDLDFSDTKESIEKEVISQEARDEFISQADYHVKKKKAKPKLHPDLKRDFKAVNIGLNKGEFKLLEEACDVACQGHVAFLRTALLKHAKEILRNT